MTGKRITMGRWLTVIVTLGLFLTSLQPTAGYVGEEQASGTAIAQAQRRPHRPQVVDAEAMRNRRPNETWYIVSLKDDRVDPVAVAEETRSVAPESTAIGFIYRHAINGFSARLTRRQVERLKADDRVAGVMVDGPVERYIQTIPDGVDRIEASPLEKNATARINGIDGADGSVERVNVGVAVLDGAVYPGNTDLNFEAQIDCTNDAEFGGDWHATHVAGTIGALDNTDRVVGVAPGVKIYSYKVFPTTGPGSWSYVTCALDAIAENPALTPVANMSLGADYDQPVDDGNCGNTFRDPVHQAICQVVNAGVTVVVAAGNDCIDAQFVVPAAYDEVITVGAMTDSDGLNGGAGSALSDENCAQQAVNAPDDQFAPFSNWGDDVDILAPGVEVLSLFYSDQFHNSGTAYASGTSMAAPHVAGAAALYIATHATATPADVKAGLLAAREAVTIPNPWPNGGPAQMTQGVLNVNDYGAWGSIPDTTDPTVSITSPAAGAKVKSPVVIHVTAADAGGSGLRNVKLFRCTGTTADTCTIQIGTDTSAPFSFTVKQKKGTLTFMVTATDNAGNTTNSPVRSVTIKRKR